MIDEIARHLINYIVSEKAERYLVNYLVDLSKTLGPQTLEEIESKWNDVPYKIIHKDSKKKPWHLRFTGIELPQYDRMYDGPHNNIVRMLFTHLLARELDWKDGNEPGDFYDPDDVNYVDTVQIPGCQVEGLAHGNNVARKTIDSYLSYQVQIEAAILEIERIYKIDPTTYKSLDFGLDGKRRNVEEHYPNFRDLIPVFREKLGLDYLSEGLH